MEYLVHEPRLLLTPDTSRSLIKNMTLTQRDFDEIEKMMDEKFEEQLRNIPTKDEFYIKMDEVMGELKGIREEVTVFTHQVSGH